MLNDQAGALLVVHVEEERFALFHQASLEHQHFCIEVLALELPEHILPVFHDFQAVFGQPLGKYHDYSIGSHASEFFGQFPLLLENRFEPPTSLLLIP